MNEPKSDPRRPRMIARRLHKRLAELTEVAESFDLDVRYTEREVTNRLAKRFTDPIFVRRLLIEHRLFDRTIDGAAYWRVVDQGPAETLSGEVAEKN